MMADTVESINRMAPVINAAIENQRRIQQTLSPILKSLEPTMEIVANITRSIQPVLNSITFPSFVTEAPAAETRAEAKPTLIRRTSAVDLPIGATWHGVKISFKDEHTIKVRYECRLIGIYSAEKLGFTRGNTNEARTNYQWDLLRILSMEEFFDGKWKPTVENLMDHFDLNKNTVEKRKELLTTTLKEAFGIDDNPFHKYNKLVGYKPKFQLFL